MPLEGMERLEFSYLWSDLCENFRSFIQVPCGHAYNWLQEQGFRMRRGVLAALHLRFRPFGSGPQT